MKNLRCSKSTFFLTGKIIFIIFCSFLFTFQVSAGPGRLDLTFRSALKSDSGVRAMEIQPDGKILLGGSFNIGDSNRLKVVRLNSDGTVDTGFNFNYAPQQYLLGEIYCLKVLPDGKFLIGGYANNIDGGVLKPLFRFHANGSIDTTFNPPSLGGTLYQEVTGLDVQNDGKILVTYHSPSTKLATRLHPDGSVEMVNGAPFRFKHDAGSENQVVYLPDENKILVAGIFSYTIQQGGRVYNSLARYNVDGTIDPTFTVDFSVAREVRVEPLRNGKYLVSGRFDEVNGVPRPGLAILNSNGSLDMSFAPVNVESNGYDTFPLYAMNGSIVVAQPDGKVTILRRNYYDNFSLIRLNADGTIDKTFYAGRGIQKKAQFSLLKMKIQNNNKLLIGGQFSRYNIFPRPSLVRINL
jgi:uncharacterized delta-60 repeat protein